VEGVDYIGSVGQARLAQDTAAMAALAYPSTFAEMFGIVVAEAMVVGAAVFTTDLGALPEVTAGHAAMIGFQPDKAKLTQDFTDLAIRELQDARHNPEAAMMRRQERIAFARKNYLWSERAKEWAAWIAEVIEKAKAAPSSDRL
jgi:glycosyltransferase involved in cell wall biosynthesis